MPKKSTPEAISPADRYAGMRLRQLRTLKGISQEKLAEALGISFQQVQKYENGKNGMAVTRLDLLAKFFKITTDYFFNNPSASPTVGFGESKQDSLEGTPGKANDNTDQELAREFELLSRRETLELVRNWYQITDDKQRRKTLDMIKSFATKG